MFSGKKFHKIKSSWHWKLLKKVINSGQKNQKIRKSFFWKISKSKFYPFFLDALKRDLHHWIALKKFMKQNHRRNFISRILPCDFRCQQLQPKENNLFNKNFKPRLLFQFLTLNWLKWGNLAWGCTPIMPTCKYWAWEKTGIFQAKIGRCWLNPPLWGGEVR